MSSITASQHPDPIIVYPLKAKGGSKWKNNELKYSLRSVEKFFKTQSGEPPKVFILSDASLPWLDKTEVTHLRIRGYAEAVVAAIELAREHSPTRDYVWMNDDICFLANQTGSDLREALHTGRMTPGNKESRKEVGGWRWKLIGVRERLAELGWREKQAGGQHGRPFNYSLHIPYLFNADLMEMTAGLFGLQYKTPLETAYWNFWKDEIPYRRAKDERIIRHAANASMPFDLRGYRFLNYNDRGCDAMMKGYLAGMFPHPSKYEKAK